VGGTVSIPAALQPVFEKHKADIVFHGWLSEWLARQARPGQARPGQARPGQA
jgi:hypothetical protein